eukprot:gene6587-13326_t
MPEAWDLYCSLDYEQQEFIDSISKIVLAQKLDGERPCTSSDEVGSPHHRDGDKQIDGLQHILTEADSSCRIFISELDKVLSVLDDVATAYADVTGRTNNLMINCENLLEQQYSLQSTVENLRMMLDPFNDVEDAAGLLGIPVDANGKQLLKKINNVAIDPRSKEFQDILRRISKALRFLRDHPDFKDSGGYLHWLEQLQHRATSLVARSMLELLDSAKKACMSAQQQQQHHQRNGSSQRGQQDSSLTPITSTPPLESSPAYQKFRGLGFRMRELGALLHCEGGGGGDVSESFDNGPSSVNGQDAQHEVKQSYMIIRSDILLNIVKEMTSAYSNNNSNNNSLRTSEVNTNGSSAADSVVSSTNRDSSLGLCQCIRQSYSLLLRLTQLELQLYTSMFSVPVSTHNNNNNDNDGNGNELNNSLSDQGDDDDVIDGDKGRNNAAQGDVQGVIPGGRSSLSLGEVDMEACPEVRSIVDVVSRATGDTLRPLIIHESDVDSLCRVVNALAEDVKTQILSQKLPRVLQKSLLTALNCTVTDAQERLVYCSELRLRQDVQMFEPLHSHLSYPDILEKASGESRSLKNKTTSNGMLSSPSPSSSHGRQVSVSTPVEDVAKTWYPPLRQTLTLLSKLYGVVDRFIFEDFARRAVSICVQALRTGADGVRRVRSQLHADLFLVRHLLVLREQLLPFEIKLTSVEFSLDFSPTGHALSRLSHSWLRLDGNNAFLQIAREGLPGLRETQVDGKRELDVVLKNACASLKTSAVRTLLGTVEAFLAKVTAFVGEIPGNNNGTSAGTGAGTGTWSVAASRGLQGQAFMRPDRVKELLQTVEHSMAGSCPELRNTLQLYIENPVARAILLKPIQHDIDILRRKVEVVIANCIDSPQARRELERLLMSIASTISSELTH